MNESKQTWKKPANEIAGKSNRQYGSPAEIRRAESILTESLFKRLLRKIFPDQRKQERIPEPPLLGYLGIARGSKPYDVNDVSLNGFCLMTGEHWEPGTEMPVTLQRTNVSAGAEDECFTIQALVVRRSGDSVAFSILLSEEESDAVFGNPLQVRWASKQEMQLFLDRLKTPDESSAAQSGRGVEIAEGISLKAAAFHAGHTVLTHGAGD